ncbi:hypothetical protein ABW02_24645 [Niallia circulans]|uniref:Uncharacterized protein n=1 Tax=Niallia circulans TaxID=1397 RepID=A0A0J1HV39_NIACI|nr:hypothetical protein [Niallia circulans]KLV17572.1 hypothetical protein ABW02_24645 [Niallia circulans]
MSLSSELVKNDFIQFPTDYTDMVIRYELGKYEYIEIPFIMKKMECKELAELIIEKSSREEKKTLVEMIKLIQKRNSSPKGYLGILAVALSTKE